MSANAAARTRIATACLLALGLVPAAAPATAQTSQFQTRGLVDLAATSGEGALYENWLDYGTSNFDPYGLRVFGTGPVTGSVTAFTQLAATEQAGAWVEGAYLLWTPWLGRDLHVEAGKVPWAVGTWEDRSYSDRNPLVGLPLLYQYRTSLREDAVPASADALFLAAGTGLTGPDYGLGAGEPGMPVVSGRSWDFGVIANGSARPVEFALGMVNGAPGAPSAAPDENRGKSVLGRVGFAPRPELRIGASGSYGPYLPEEVAGSLPAGKSVDDYHQILAMADAEVRLGHFEARAEAYTNRWESPMVGDLDVRGGYVEGKATLAPSLYLAGRYEVMRFGDITGVTVARRPWDENRDRVEIGAGYRLARRVTMKTVFQRNVEHPTGEEPEREDLKAVAISLGF